MLYILENEILAHQILKTCFTLDDNIRINHVLVDSLDNSVSRVTAWRHEALQSDAKQLPKGQNCLSYLQTRVGFFFLHTFGCQRFNKSIFTFKYPTFMSAF